jgi:hypothetical protein
LFSYASRVICTAIGVPVIWHFVFVERVIAPIAGPVFTDSNLWSVVMMICFWFVGSAVGLMLHSSLDKQVSHIASAIDKQGLVFALESSRRSVHYVLFHAFLMFVVFLAYLLGVVVSALARSLSGMNTIDWFHFGNLSFGLPLRVCCATAFCTFLTWIASLYLCACIDPHPSCTLSVEDARALSVEFSTKFNASLVSGRIEYRCLT